MSNEVAIYIRKSTTDRQKNSLLVQRSSMIDYIGSKPSKVFSDESTGKTLDRAGLQDAFAWLEKSKDRKLVFYKVCRYGRTIDSFSGLRKFINKDQVRFMDLGDMSAPIDFTMLQIKLVLAENESRLLGDRVSRTHKVLASQGKGWGAGDEQLSSMRSKSTASRKASSIEWANKAFDLNKMLEDAGITSQSKRVAKMNDLGFTTPRGSKITASRLSQAVSKARFVKRMNEA